MPGFFILKKETDEMNIISFASRRIDKTCGLKKPLDLWADGYFECLSEAEGKVRLKGMDGAKVLVRAESFNGAMQGDLVRVRYTENKNRAGMISEIMYRAHSVCYGMIYKKDEKILLKPDNTMIKYPVLVTSGGKLSVGEYISAQIIKYPTGTEPVIIVTPQESFEMHGEKVIERGSGFYKYSKKLVLAFAA